MEDLLGAGPHAQWWQHSNITIANPFAGIASEIAALRDALALARDEIIAELKSGNEAQVLALRDALGLVRDDVIAGLKSTNATQGQILEKLERIEGKMAQLEDAMTAIEGAVGQAATDVLAEIDRMIALVAQGASPAQVQAATDRAKAMVASLQNLDAAAVAAGQPIPVPPVPGPTP